MFQKLIINVLFLLGYLYNAKAQDASYWASGYGAAGFFTPGAVIANNHDSGVLYFNPALLAYDKRNAASISGTVYQWQSVLINNGAGTGHHLMSANESIVPLIASNTIRLKTKIPFTLVYALVHTPVINFQSSQYKNSSFDVLDNSYSPGPENFIGQYSLGSNVRQTTALVSAGLKLNPKLAGGISIEAQIRNQNYLLNYSSQSIINDGNMIGFPKFTTVAEYYLARTMHAGIKLKAGISYDISDAHHIGAIISSPLMHAAGKSNIIANSEISNLNLGDGVELNLLANTRQNKLKSKWKMPFSIAAGYIYHHRKGEVYIVAEYFGRLKEYNIITPCKEQFIRTDSSDWSVTTNLLRMKDVRKPIVNAGIGMSWFFKETLTGFLSLRTDFTYADRTLYSDTDGYLPNITEWNNYHCQIGVNTKRKRFNLRTGILLTYGGTRQMMQGINFDDPNESNLLLGNTGKTRASLFSAGIMVSYIHNL
ncbi:hypothetical protein DC498_06290 [Terrimonas sp.]|uniref:hypothetical protein n=1 Tax=Terrimonas sp. TaxID=1914338 RepID=UPI000D50B1B0|nr:hypothetical protein [Terrimonas sp.]PVD52973.1 hypothetical protein DC498_06290 [Terrimonas sp.]